MKVFLLSGFLISTGIHAFEPGMYVSTKYAKPFLYIETSSHKQFMRNLRAFYLSLRKGRKTGKSEWNTITKLLSSKIGFPLFNAKGLSKIGIDLNSKFAFITSQDPHSGKNVFQLFIPAKKPAKLFNFIKRSSPKPQELKSGVLLKRNAAFIAKGREHIIFANIKKYALSAVRPAKNNLTEIADYKIMQKKFKIHSSQVARFILFEKSFDILSLITRFFTPTRKKDHSSEARVSRLVRAMGGEFNIDKRGIDANLRYIMNENFFKDKVLSDLSFRVKPKDISGPRLGGLAPDHFKGKKMVYFSALIDPALTFSRSRVNLFFKPKDTAIYYNAIKQISKEYLRGDIAGVVSNYVGKMPTNDLSQWEISLSFGLKDNVNIQSLQKDIETTLNNGVRRSKTKLIKSQFQNRPLWELKTLAVSPSSTKKNRSLFFLFQPKELSIFTQKRNARSFLAKKGNSIIKSKERLLKIKEENVVGFLLCDLSFIYNRLRRSALAQTFGMYLAYFENLDKVLGFVSQGNESIKLNLKILLK